MEIPQNKRLANSYLLIGREIFHMAKNKEPIK